MSKTYQITDNDRIYTVTTCTTCEGTGREWHEGYGDEDDACYTCSGAGEITDEDRYEVDRSCFAKA